MWNDMVSWENRHMKGNGKKMKGNKEYRNKIKELRKKESRQKIASIYTGERSYMKNLTWQRRSSRTVTAGERSGISPATKSSSNETMNQVTQEGQMAVDTSGSLARLIQREKMISVQEAQQKNIERRKLALTKKRIRDLEKQMDIKNEEVPGRTRTRLEKEREKERTAKLVFDRTKKTQAQWRKECKQYKKALMENIRKVVVNTHVCSECKLPHTKDMIRLCNYSWNVGKKVCLHCIRAKGITNVSLMPQ